MNHRVFVSPIDEPPTIIEVSESWLRAKMNEFSETLDAMDPQERDALIEKVGFAVTSVAMWPIMQRYYRKRNAPPWLVPVLFGLYRHLGALELAALRAERQAIRDRKTRLTEIVNARGGV